MKTAASLLLAIVILLTSVGSFAETYCLDGDERPVSTSTVSEHDESPSDQDAQHHAGHHCGHLAQHFLGQPASGLPFGDKPVTAHFEGLRAPHPLAISDTPIRPPRLRLS